MPRMRTNGFCRRTKQELYRNGNRILFWLKRGDDRQIPIVNENCCFCGRVVDPHNADELCVARVNGDSANGYELYHYGCCK